MRAWETEAETAAQAFNVTLVVGVRQKGTWFAAATRNGSTLIECDGSGPSAAVNSIIKNLVTTSEIAARRSEDERRAHQVRLDSWNRMKSDRRKPAGAA